MKVSNSSPAKPLSVRTICPARTRWWRSSSAAIASRSPQKPNRLTHKHNALNHLFHALVKARGHSPEPVSEAAQARSRKQQEDLGQEE